MTMMIIADVTIQHVLIYPTVSYSYMCRCSNGAATAAAFSQEASGPRNSPRLGHPIAVKGEEQLGVER